MKLTTFVRQSILDVKSPAKGSFTKLAFCIVTGAAFLSSALAQTLPVTSGIMLHLDASSITGLSDGDTVNTWPNSTVSGLSGGTTGVSGTPLYRPNSLNGRPTVEFPVGVGLETAAAGYTFTEFNNIRTVFWVVNEAATPGFRFLLGDDNSFDFHRGPSGFLYDGFTAPQVRDGQTLLNGSTVNGTSTVLPGGWNLLSVETTGNATASRFSQDRSLDRRWEGNLAELIIYNRVLSNAEMKQVSSYLVTKYTLPADLNSPPTLTTTSPTVGATNVGRGNNLIATFNEPIFLGSGDIIIKNLSDSSQTTITLPSPQVTVSGNALTINPANNLLPSTSYAIRLANTVVKDRFDNNYLGISDDTTWTFTTSSTPAGTLRAPQIITNNATSGISSDFIYTHAFNTGGGNETINGVPFTGSGDSSPGFYSSTNFGGATSGNFGEFPSGDNVRQMLDPFRFGGVGQTLTITGLTAGQRYDARIYTREWVAGNRSTLITFDEDGSGPNSSSITYNPDGAPDAVFISYVFTATADPLVVSFAGANGNTNAGFHLSGFTVEQAETIAPTLTTLSPVNGASPVGAGNNLIATFSEPISIGNGDIIIKNLSNSSQTTITLPSPQVTAFGNTLTINPTSNLLAGTNYAIQIASTAIIDRYSNNYLGISDDTSWTFTTSTTAAGTLGTPQIITDNATSGISSSSTYPLAFNMAGDNVTINGVQFSPGDVSGTGTSGTSYSSTNFGNVFGLVDFNFEEFASMDSVRQMLGPFRHGSGTSGQTLTITGLTAGQRYDARIYTREFGAGANRTHLITFDEDGVGPNSSSITYNADGFRNAVYISYVFTATSESLVVSFALANGNTGDTFHLSGFSVQNVIPPGFSTWATANNAVGQSPQQDHDNDGVPNGVEYFMGESGSSFTLNPSLNAANQITWPAGSGYVGNYEVQTSTNLGSWTNVTPKPTVTAGVLNYTLPPAAPGGKSFVRLFVTPAP